MNRRDLSIRKQPFGVAFFGGVLVLLLHIILPVTAQCCVCQPEIPLTECPSVITIDSGDVPVPEQFQAIVEAEIVQCGQIGQYAIAIPFGDLCNEFDRPDFRTQCGCTANSTPQAQTPVAQPVAPTVPSPVAPTPPSPTTKAPTTAAPTQSPTEQPVTASPVAAGKTASPTTSNPTNEPTEAPTQPVGTPTKAPVVDTESPVTTMNPTDAQPVSSSPPPTQQGVPPPSPPVTLPVVDPPPSPVVPDEFPQKCCVCWDDCVSTPQNPGGRVPLPESVAAVVGITTATCQQIHQFGETKGSIPPDYCEALNREDFRIECQCPNAASSNNSSLVPAAAPSSVSVDTDGDSPTLFKAGPPYYLVTFSPTVESRAALYSPPNFWWKISAALAVLLLGWL